MEEEDLLFEAVFAFTQCLPGENPVAGIPWIQVAHRVGSRSERQCRKKWLSYCSMKRAGAVEWNDEDEIHLINRFYNVHTILEFYIYFIKKKYIHLFFYKQVN